MAEPRTTAADDVDAFADLNGWEPQAPVPSAFQGVSPGAFLSQSARAGRALSLAAAPAFMAYDKGIDFARDVGDVLDTVKSRGAITPPERTPSTEASDWYFSNVTEGLGTRAVDHWRPDEVSTGGAARIVNGVFDVAGAVPQIVSMPSVFVATSGIDPTVELTNQGVDLGTAGTVGAVNATVNAIGLRIPAAFGTDLATRVATGAGSNVALGASADVASSQVLSSQGYDEQAASYNPLDPTARLMDGLMGTVFGLAYRGHFRPSDQAAALTAHNADHVMRQTLPGEPLTREAGTQHADDLARFVTAALNGEPRPQVQGDLLQFKLRPELQPARATGFDAAVNDVLQAEGGFVNDAADRGGATNFGISSRANPDVNVANLTPEAAKAIYRERYWNAIDADALPPAMQGPAFDAAVNQGVGWTKAALREAGGDPAKFLALREARYREIVANDPSQAKFLRGWLNRLDRFDAGPRPAYTADAAPRLDGETDKAYAKRVIDKLPEPDAARLPDNPDLYFQTTGADLVPVRDLVSSKTDAENAQGGGNGLKRMAAAAEGVLGKRKPIEVLRNVDGTFTVTDGNGTLTAARTAGFERLPVKVVGERTVAEQAPHLPEPTAIKLGEKYAEAHAVKPAFDEAVNDIARKIGATAEHGPIKSVGRASKKIMRDYSGDAGQIKDLVRSTIVLDSPQQLQAALAESKSAFGDLIGLRNSLEEGSTASPEGYRDVKFNVMRDGHMVELQFNYPEMLAAKKQAHALYAEVDSIRDRLLEENRDPTPEEIKRLNELEAEQQAIYLPAWDAILARNSASVSGTPSRTAVMENLRGSDLSQARDFQSGVSETGMPSKSANRVPAGNATDSFIASSSGGSIAKIPLSRGEFPVQGDSATVVTERGLRVPIRYAVVEAESLVASHDDALNPNPAFPAELQPRDRARAASAQQITRIANNLNPELLAESPKAADGAPIVGQDKVVESGNARTIAVRRAYATGKADGYRQFLVAEAERFGLDPAAVEGLREPMLVRVALEEGRDRAEFARQANEQTVAGMSATEQAMSDARNLPDMAELVTNDDGTINMRASGRFVQGFIQKAVGPNERATMSTAAGDLSQQGQTRIRAAVFARAYGDADLVGMMAEATDANVKNLLAGMLRAAPEIARLREMIAEGGRYGPDLAPDLVMAVRKFSQLRSEGTTVEQFEAQGDFFGEGGLTPKARDLLRVVNENARAPKRMAEFLQRYVADVDALGDPRQADMLGGGKDADAAIATASKATREAHEPTTMRPGADMFGVGRRPAAAEQAPTVTPENRAAYEAIAANPDLQVIDENGVVRPANEFLAEGRADAEQAAETQRAIEAAANCFTRNAA